MLHFRHALRPRELGTLLGLTWPEQDLQALLDIVHEVLGGVGVVQEVLADDELRDPLRIRLRPIAPWRAWTEATGSRA